MDGAAVSEIPVVDGSSFSEIPVDGTSEFDDSLALPEEATNDAATNEVSMADIFGDFGGDDGIESEREPGVGADPRAAARGPAGTAQDLWLPSLPRPPMLDRVHTIRLPKVVSVALQVGQTACVKKFITGECRERVMQAYNTETYNEAEEVAALRAAGKEAAIDAMIRFRFRRDAAGRLVTDEIGTPLRESNTRVRIHFNRGSLPSLFISVSH